jgi:hypothetical protein
MTVPLSLITHHDVLCKNHIMATLPVLLFLVQSGGRSAKSTCKQSNFSIKVTDFRPGNYTLVYWTESLQAERRKKNQIQGMFVNHRKNSVFSKA